MEFKLKEGWLDYFMSGLLIGAVAVLLSFFQYFQTGVNITIEIVFWLFAIVLLSVFSFIMGCRVKKKPQA